MDNLLNIGSFLNLLLFLKYKKHYTLKERLLNIQYVIYYIELY